MYPPRRCPQCKGIDLICKRGYQDEGVMSVSGFECLICGHMWIASQLEEERENERQGVQ